MKKIAIFTIVFVVGVLLYYFYTSGAAQKTAEAVDNVADEMTGNRAVRQGQELEDQIDEIKDLRRQQFRQLEEVHRER